MISNKNTSIDMNDILNGLEKGLLRVVEKKEGVWHINRKVFKQINEFFKLPIKYSGIAGCIQWKDKLSMQTKDYSNEHMNEFNSRSIPGSWIRAGSYLGKQTVVMSNSFINIGAHIGDKTMIDSGVTIGSCAYIGANCHISSNTVIAGVLEPSQYDPVIIEEDVFIGAQCLIAEGVKIPQGTVIAAGTTLTSSTKITDYNGEVVSEIPSYSVIVPGSYKRGKVFLECADIIKQVDEGTRSKTSINDLLR